MSLGKDGRREGTDEGLKKELVLAVRGVAR